MKTCNDAMSLPFEVKQFQRVLRLFQIFVFHHTSLRKNGRLNSKIEKPKFWIPSSLGILARMVVYVDMYV